ncbi:MAG: ATP-binding protein [Erysipelotrichaceae bacterium]|nr:ATP-binding protein [Erysipelotrichaceae bacterium]
MEIKRDKYLFKLIDSKNDGLVKIITGIRRCGKSYLLFELFYKHLLENGVKNENIIKFAFDNDEDIDKLDNYCNEESTKIYLDKGKRKYIVNSKKFRAYLSDITNASDNCYILLDEVQLLQDFVGTLNALSRHNNFDIYVTGSNSRFLSNDVASEFRARGEQIRINPLSFKEFFDAHKLSFEDAYKEYQFFGGLPYISKIGNDDKKAEYLKEVFDQLYIKDLLDRYEISSVNSFNKLIDILSSSIGSYTNPTNLENVFKSSLKISYHHDTIANHIQYLKEAFLIKEAVRYDVKGKKYVASNSKYYFTDLGLRNVRLNFRQQEPTHIMENIIYNELIIRGFNVDVGIVEKRELNEKGNGIIKQLEVDFVCNQNNKRYYIQSAYSINDEDKKNKELRPLLSIKDNFKKIVIINDNFKPWIDDNGIYYISLKDFLLDEKSLD